MADNVVFDVDTSDIIVKLHFAGLQKTRDGQNAGFFVNTGIINDDPKGSPEKVGKTRFDLTNKSNSYQFGWVVKLNWEQDDDITALDNMITDVFKLRAQANGAKSIEDDAKGKTDKKLTDKNTSADQKTNKQLEELKAEVKKQLKDIGIYKNDDEIEAEFNNQANGLTNIKNALAKQKNAKTKNDSAFKQEFDKTKADAVNYITNYMNVFAGPDNVKMSENSIGVMQVPLGLTGPNDKALVKMFEIQPISDQEKGKEMAQIRAKPKDAKIALCFYVNYSLNVEK